jgi:hypothetical protein
MMQPGFEVTGSKGCISVLSGATELRCYRAGSNPRTAGSVRIEAGPQHPPYGNFIVAPGHQPGFNDLTIIEVADFLKAIADGPMTGPDFREAGEI